MEANMVRTQIQLTEKQAKRVRQIAGARRISMAEAIRQGLDAFLRDAVALDREEQVRRALAASGRFRSGSADTSSAHDAALAEAYRA
jgi:Arc/MetJ-type ribon-helix-helix transcriptional regulator